MATRQVVAWCLVVLLSFQPLLATAAEKEEGGSGAGATVTLVSKVLAEGRFDFRAAWDLASDPYTWLGAFGGIMGFTVAGALAHAFLPPGVGIFVSALPRFLGAALGFELVQGRIKDIDPLALVFQVMATTAGYAAAAAVFGAAAPSWLLMAGSLIFGVAANLIIRRKPVGDDDVDVGFEETDGTEEASAPKSPGAEGLDEKVKRLREQYRLLLDASHSGQKDLEGRLSSYEDARREYREALEASR